MLASTAHRKKPTSRPMPVPMRTNSTAISAFIVGSNAAPFLSGRGKKAVNGARWVNAGLATPVAFLTLSRTKLPLLQATALLLASDALVVGSPVYPSEPRRGAPTNGVITAQERVPRV